MITNYFTLVSLRKELDFALRRRMVCEVYSQTKNQLWITCREHPERTGSGSSLCVSVDPGSNYCFLRSEHIRAKKNSVDLFPKIVGLSLVAIEVVRNERILRLEFTDATALIVKLFDTSDSNILHIGADNVVAGAFKHGKSLVGNEYKDESRTVPAGLIHEKDFESTFTSGSSKSVLPALKKYLPLLGSTLANEVLYRSSIDADTKTDRLTSEDLHTLFHNLQRLAGNELHSVSRIYATNKGKKIFSFIVLESLSDAPFESYSTINDGIRTFVQQNLHGTETESPEEVMKRKFAEEAQRLQRSIDHMSRQLNEGSRHEDFEHIGKLLTANIHHMTKGLKEIDLRDTPGESRELHITLEPHLTPSQNAARYFEKAKKSRVAESELRRRREQAEQRLSSIHKLVAGISEEHSKEGKRELLAANKSLLHSMKLSQGDEKDLPPFRIFIVAGGYEVWVGKNSANNDELTIKYARPHDFWFHARGASGSHTVLRTQKSIVPPKEAISQAASIAAYYSKMRNASNVPVAWCERKYVRKPKGSPPGTVVLEREKVIFVQPRLPQNYPHE